MNANQHTHYMTLALSLAEQGRLTVTPNPMVGCVIVKDNHIIGTGYHQYAGKPHAEIYALNEAGQQAEGACVYVTLEPCCHHGKTPPCTDALIKAGIKKIYIACIDPNSLMSGKSVELLRAAGIEVEVGLCATAAQQLNEVFFHYIKTQRPFVIAKWGMSLDGETIVNQGDSKQITGSVSQQHTHRLRQQVDAILIGSRTAHHDDPQLTVRLADVESNLKQPLRIILGGQHPLPKTLKIFSEQLPGKTLVFITQRNAHHFLDLRELNNVELITLPEDTHQKSSLTALLDELGKRKITSVLVEGGKTIHDSFFRENLVNKIHVYIAPTIIKGYDYKHLVRIDETATMGQDFYINASIEDQTYV